MTFSLLLNTGVHNPIVIPSTQKAIHETIKSHLPVGDVTRNDYSGIKIRIPYLSHRRQVMYDVRHGHGTSLCVYISG